MKLISNRDIAWLALIAMAAAAVLAWIQPAAFLPGWVGLSLLLTLGTVTLLIAARWGGGGRALVLMTGLALGLRIVVGATLYVVLPLDGYDEPDDRAGHVFTDAHRRDDQAWQLASSREPIVAAFDRSYYTDQYGGLLAASAETYRVLSPDAHRPLLILVLAAIFASLGVPFFFRAATRFWGSGLAVPATWWYCLYPESVLTGGAQMREPFLLTFISIGLWGLAELSGGSRRGGWLWLAVAMLGLLAVSPGIALALLVLLIIWLRIRGTPTESALTPWILAALVSTAAVLFLAWSVRTAGSSASTPLGLIVRWFQDSFAWVVFQLERGSGQIQNVFSKLFPMARFAFVVAYGITQPVLPPAFLEPTTLTWHIIGVARSLGWYVILPLLIYFPFGLREARAGSERRAWSWLAVFGWFWIVLCAIRAGGDQWDNPRYRLIFFGVHALLITQAWQWWKVARDAWLPRILAAEILCLLLFGQWYLARYYLIGIHLPILVVMAGCIAGVAIILVGGAVWDKNRKRRRGN